MKRSSGVAVVALLSGILSGCVTDEDDSKQEVGVVEQALDAARARVVQEASFAMTGNYGTYTTTNWPTADTYGNHYYTSTDIGAWNALLNAPRYTYGSTVGFFVSCMRRRSEGHLPSPYTACQLSTSSGYGSFEMPYYTCQGSCPSTRMHGGQCKPFMNLVAYRSGQYHGANFAFKALPSDGTISSKAPSDPDMPVATYANILEGDLLRRPGGHAVIVVRKISSSQVVVFDSNWLGGDGAENVGSHSFGFSGSGNSNLGNYRVLKCVYTGNC